MFIVKTKIFKIHKLYVGGLAVAVPGALKGYSAIYNLYGGGVPWESLFEPAIQLCENGMDISKLLETNIKNNQDMIENDPSLRYNLNTIYSHISLFYPLIFFYFLKLIYICIKISHLYRKFIIRIFDKLHIQHGKKTKKRNIQGRSHSLVTLWFDYL